MDKRKDIGRLGEEAVCKWLIERGHTILDRNWRNGHLEIDIVSLHGNGIHFVEVKSRVAPVTANPEESVRSKKKRNMVKAAQKYISVKAEAADAEIFIDVASVTFNCENTEIQYFTGAYTPIYFTH